MARLTLAASGWPGLPRGGNPCTAVVNVSIEACRSLEAFDRVSRQCLCAFGAGYSVALARCECPPSSELDAAGAACVLRRPAAALAAWWVPLAIAVPIAAAAAAMAALGVFISRRASDAAHRKTGQLVLPLADIALVAPGQIFRGSQEFGRVGSMSDLAPSDCDTAVAASSRGTESGATPRWRSRDPSAVEDAVLMIVRYGATGDDVPKLFYRGSQVMVDPADGQLDRFVREPSFFGSRRWWRRAPAPAPQGPPDHAMFPSHAPGDGAGGSLEHGVRRRSSATVLATADLLQRQQFERRVSDAADRAAVAVARRMSSRPRTVDWERTNLVSLVINYRHPCVCTVYGALNVAGVPICVREHGGLLKTALIAKARVVSCSP